MIYTRAAKHFYVTVANVRPYDNEERHLAVYYKSLVAIAVSEKYWRLPPSPMLENMCGFPV